MDSSNRFIAYFDLLGYKEFIMNNSEDKLVDRLNNIFAYVAIALSRGKSRRKEKGDGFVSDISDISINCINISDTIIYYSNDDTLESFREILETAAQFNDVINRSFPTRGALTCGGITFYEYSADSEKGGSYRQNVLTGKGLVEAHEKGENLNIASCVIDKSVIDTISKQNGNIENLVKDQAILYKVPYKKENPRPAEEYLMTRTISDKESYKSKTKELADAFKMDNKTITKRAKELFLNTVKFYWSQVGTQDEFDCEYATSLLE